MHLRKSEIKELNERLQIRYGDEFLNKKDKVEKKDNIIFINDKQAFTEIDSEVIPTLKFLLNNFKNTGKAFLKTITVDMGAIKFVCNGADIMRPGITKVDDGIIAGDIILIVDETHGKPLAIGKTTLSKEELLETKEGKVIKNLHWIGDDVWNSPN